jgi:hypothetical protein
LSYLFIHQMLSLWSMYPGLKKRRKNRVIDLYPNWSSTRMTVKF